MFWGKNEKKILLIFRNLNENLKLSGIYLSFLVLRTNVIPLRELNWSLTRLIFLRLCVVPCE